jgi:hypothetical protein
MIALGVIYQQILFVKKPITGKLINVNFGVQID